MAARAALTPTTSPGTGDGFAIPQSYPFNPFGRQDAFGAEFAVDSGDVNSVPQSRLSSNEFRHPLGIICLIFEVRFKEEALTDIWNEAVEGNVEESTINPRNYPINCSQR